MIVFYIAIFIWLCQIATIASENQRSNSGQPLILTPYIKLGKIYEARQHSSVTPFLRNVISNSGFLTVNETYNANLYFWFFRKTTSNWINAPLLLWLQGGPGCSSMLALFVENGPYQVKKGTIRARKHSWTNEYNVLYIDNPVGTGYSFSNDYYPQEEQEVADHLYEALTQFFQLYPELRSNEFYITGESYAGKYIPAIAHKIYKTNPLSTHRIPLTGLLIGNGFSDPENMLDFGVHLHRLGLIDYRTKINLESIQEKTRILIRNQLWKEALSQNGQILQIIRNATEFTHLYDYINDYEKSDKSYLDFIRKDDTRRAIHVGNLPFEICSKNVSFNMRTDAMKSIRRSIEELLEHFPILFYNGMLDIRVAHFLTTKFLDELHWNGAEKYRNSSRENLYIDGLLAGYYKSAGNLKYILIIDAGHMVPKSKPKVMIDIIKNFINHAI